MTFQPGKSGNPLGRPKGSGDKRSEIRRILESWSVEVLDTLKEMALVDKDPSALKLIMERISPKPKSESLNLGIQVNNLNSREEIREMINEVMISTLNGDVPDDQGKSIIALVKTASDLDDKHEMKRRLEVIEEKLGVNQ